MASCQFCHALAEGVKQTAGGVTSRKGKYQPLTGALEGGALSPSPSIFKAERLGWTGFPGDGADMVASVIECRANCGRFLSPSWLQLTKAVKVMIMNREVRWLCAQAPAIDGDPA